MFEYTVEDIIDRIFENPASVEVDEDRAYRTWKYFTDNRRSWGSFDAKEAFERYLICQAADGGVQRHGYHTWSPEERAEWDAMYDR